jgi:predicted transcriptional regulator
VAGLASQIHSEVFGSCGSEKHETEIMLLKDKHEKAEGVLQTENANLRAEIERLKQELSKRPEPIHTSGLSDLETSILIFVAKNEGAYHFQIAEEVGLSAIKLQFHATDLEERGFIDNHWNTGMQISTITQKGLRYLNERELLN